MTHRELGKIIKVDAEKYPVIGLLGARQTGKTTLAKMLFEKKPYFNLEDIEQRSFAMSDPKGFLLQSPEGMIIDEIQRVPQLLSFIQILVDSDDKAGQFIITGSQNFMLMDSVSQSLAGRISLFNLLPFSLKELGSSYLRDCSLEKAVYNGFYPRLHHKKIQAHRYYLNYVNTYIEKDVRQLKNIVNISVFQKFIRMCAARVGQLFNASSIADDLGVEHNTVKSWLSVLEASYLVFLVRPHHNNLNKRLVKMPKLYFYDTGLLTALLRIDNYKTLVNHALKGSIFENFVICEYYKHFTNKGLVPPIYFWRDNHGKEIDLLLDYREMLIPLEIKAGKTIVSDFFKGLNYYCKLAEIPYDEAYLVYGGEETQNRSNGKARSWRSLGDIKI